MTAVFTTAEIVAATGGRLLQGDLRRVWAGVSTDSRTCQAGNLFIPLKGERHDGHAYIPQALRRGAGAVLVAESWVRSPAARSLPPDLTVIAVPDTLRALGDLAGAWRRRFSGPVVGITGSCGKTTAKEMTARVLAGRFRVLKNDLNLNNLIGLPQTLLRLDGAYEAAVVEMGMNRFGEIRRLTEISRPSVGVWLNVHPAHTEGVGCLEGVTGAKAEILGALPSGALLVYNADDCRVAARAAHYPGPRLGFGASPAARLRLLRRTPRGSGGQSALIAWEGRTFTLTLAVPGRHMAMNALAALGVGLALGLNPDEASAALAGFTAIHRRSQVLTLPSGVHLLNDCYNANPGSMAAALELLAELKGRGRAAAALGDMLELGSLSRAAHRELGRRAAAAGVEFLTVVGAFREEVAAGAREAGLPAAAVRPVADKSQAVRVLQEFLQPGDWLLVKGSRSMHMEAVVAGLAAP
ncbi:MAG: UDP-N-acetylmuramoyl-tripeptide--D-alanyl-D-alanine ligase [Syntrophobacterales bacterium]|nr:UDP-N-acetylmuramoyl-tripeptide--D-alanyl-D-alanine ligase [Syntrophobacterales bacterium]